MPPPPSPPRWRAAAAAALALVVVPWTAAAAEPPDVPPRVAAVPADAMVDSIGVNVHLHYSDSVYVRAFDRTILPRLTQLGVRHLRDQTHTAEHHDADHFYYRRLRQLASRGMQFLLVTDIEDARGPATDWSKLDDIVRWSGRSVVGFENTNEPDGMSQLPSSSWVQRTREAQRAMWAAAEREPDLADVEVLTPSLVRWRDNWSLLGDLSSYADAGSWHIYPNGRGPITEERLTEAAQDPRAVTGDLPLIITETGYHNASANTSSHRSTSERDAAAYIPALLLENFANGIERTYLYELMDLYPDPTNTVRRSHFGLVHNGGQPKPSFHALRRTIAILEDGGSSRAPDRAGLGVALEGGEPGLREQLFVRGDGTYVLALWRTEIEASDARRRPLDVRVRLAERATTVRVNRPSTHARPTAVHRDVAAFGVRLRDGVSLVEITPGSS